MTIAHDRHELESLNLAIPADEAAESNENFVLEEQIAAEYYSPEAVEARRNKKIRGAIGGITAGAVAITVAVILANEAKGGHDAEPTATSQEAVHFPVKFDANKLRLQSGRFATLAQGTNILGSVLTNELYAEETGNTDGYKAAFSQLTPGDFGTFSKRVAYDQSVSPLLVAGHKRNPGTFPTQSITVVSAKKPESVNPVDGTVTIDAAIRYISDSPNSSTGEPELQENDVTAAFTFSKDTVTNMSKGGTQDIWVLNNLNNVVEHSRSIINK